MVPVVLVVLVVDGGVSGNVDVGPSELKIEYAEPCFKSSLYLSFQVRVRVRVSVRVRVRVRVTFCLCSGSAATISLQTSPSPVGASN